MPTTATSTDPIASPTTISAMTPAFGLSIDSSFTSNDSSSDVSSVAGSGVPPIANREAKTSGVLMSGFSWETP